MGDEEVFEALWVCVGRRFSNGTLYSVWSPLDEDGKASEDDQHFFKGSLKKSFSTPGAVHKVRSPDSGFSKIFTGGKLGPEYVTRYPESEELLKWRLLDEEASVADRIEKGRKQDMAENEIKECLAPIREAMASVNYTGRQRILAIVIDYLTR